MGWEVVLIVPFMMLMVYVVASIANAWQERQKDQTEPLAPLDEEWVNSCKLHVWKKVMLLTPKEAEAYNGDPKSLKGTETTYCDTCGYLPSLHKIVRPAYRQILREQEAQAQAAKARQKEIADLAEEYFKRTAAAAKFNPEQEALLRLGYDSYAQFVGILPELLEQRKLRKIMENLKFTVDNRS